MSSPLDRSGMLAEVGLASAARFHQCVWAVVCDGDPDTAGEALESLSYRSTVTRRHRIFDNRPRVPGLLSAAMVT